MTQENTPTNQQVEQKPERRSIFDIENVPTSSLTLEEVTRELGNLAAEPKTEVDLVTVPERVFVNIYLPFFAGIPEPYHVLKLPDESALNKTRGTRSIDWVKIAGGPAIPVSVIDEQQNVLFTVPPLVALEARDLGQKNRFATLGMITEKARNIRDAGNPIQTHQMNAQLMEEYKRVSGTINDEKSKQISNQWAYIYGLYGFIPGVQNIRIDAADYFYSQMLNDGDEKIRKIAEDFYNARGDKPVNLIGVNGDTEPNDVQPEESFDPYSDMSWS